MRRIPVSEDQMMVETEMERSVGLILAAAGKGIRYGGAVPKQFLSLGGVPVYLAALQKFLPCTDRIVIVIPDNWIKLVSDQVDSFRERTAHSVEIQVIDGGINRQESVLKGLRCLHGKCRHVLVHDAVRPFLSTTLITRVISAMLDYGAAVPMEPVTDTVKVIKDNMVVETLDRGMLWRAQTPQGSELQQLLDASEKAAEEGFTGTDESSLLERAGLPVRAVEGEKSNIKITWKDDLDWRNADET